MPERGFIGSNHALLTGEITGALQSAGFDVEPIVVDNLENRHGFDYTNVIRIKRLSGSWLLKIEPERYIEP